VRGYLRIVPVAPRGSNGLYVRRESADRLESPLSGPGVQETVSMKTGAVLLAPR